MRLVGTEGSLQNVKSDRSTRLYLDSDTRTLANLPVFGGSLKSE